MSHARKILGLWAVLLPLCFAGCAEFGGEEEPGERGGLAKADVFGSCQDSDCGGPALSGNCYCDEECVDFGDCCADKALECGGGSLVFTTYNAGLVDAVGLREERLQPVIDVLEQTDNDVLCLQEVWLDEDGEAIIEALSDTYPYAERALTENDTSDWFACTPGYWDDLYNLNSCVSNNCTAEGISMFECVKNQCKDVYDPIPDNCKLCLAANSSGLDPLKCAAWKAPLFGNDGRNGLVMLSKHPLENVSYTPFETYVIKRGVISADVAGFNVQCTHMTAQLDSVPYPADATFASWEEEHRASIDVMAELAGDRCTIMFGDLNTGPAAEGLSGELEDNYNYLGEVGYRDGWTENQVCTHCGDNPLVCSNPEVCGGHSSRIDHVLPRGCDPGITPDYHRFADGEVRVTDGDGKVHETRASDHYGVTAIINL